MPNNQDREAKLAKYETISRAAPSRSRGRDRKDIVSKSLMRSDKY